MILPVFKTGGRQVFLSPVGSTPTRFRHFAIVGCESRLTVLTRKINWRTVLNMTDRKITDRSMIDRGMINRSMINGPMMDRRSFLIATGLTALASTRVLGANDTIRLGVIGAGGRCETCLMPPTSSALTRLWP